MPFDLRIIFGHLWVILTTGTVLLFWFCCLFMKSLKSTQRNDNYYGNLRSKYGNPLNSKYLLDWMRSNRRRASSEQASTYRIVLNHCWSCSSTSVAVILIPSSLSHWSKSLFLLWLSPIRRFSRNFFVLSVHDSW